MTAAVRLLNAGDIRRLAGRLGLRPTKKLGQNFVIEQGTVRQIAALAAARSGDVILEVGPGLGSLTLALLDAAQKAADAPGAPKAADPSDPAAADQSPPPAPSPPRDPSPPPDPQPPQAASPPPAPSALQAPPAKSASPALSAPTGALPAGQALREASPAVPRALARLVAVEIDPVLAAELPRTIADRAPGLADRVTVLAADALTLSEEEVGAPFPTVLAANLPYNIAVPVVLNLLAALPSLRRGVVMVQAEVADRMCAGPGSRVYGTPSAKLAWYASAKLAGPVPRSVFWPVPNVDSKLVAFTRRDPPPTTASRVAVFAVIDAAFGQRRKTLRGALAAWAGSPVEAERVLRAAGVDPGARGESLAITEFARIAQFREAGPART